LPKIATESGVFVRDNRIRHAMNLEDIMHEYLSHYGAYECVLKTTKMIIYGEMIATTMMNDLLPDLGKPTMKSIEISHQIEGESKWLECAQSFDSFSLVALTGLTFSHKGVDIMFHTLPEKRTFDPFIGFGKSIECPVVGEA
jgi:hypothetical protein